ncbi:MAG: DUF4315 family protein [Synergistaceae bacterium]|jgi:hypothetical protein|nr:DUF4315 family protein [Synergistaceae bacterium]
MNQRIQKSIDEIERAKAKIAELQALLPELERKRTELENTEIVRLARSASVAPGELAAFVEAIKTNRPHSRISEGRFPRDANTGLNNAAQSGAKQEAGDHDEE